RHPNHDTDTDANVRADCHTYPDKHRRICTGSRRQHRDRRLVTHPNRDRHPNRDHSPNGDRHPNRDRDTDTDATIRGDGHTYPDKDRRTCTGLGASTNLRVRPGG
ncbi:MAG: hypothetical protein RL345_2065, partial [Chloroflexota bacterium]